MTGLMTISKDATYAPKEPLLEEVVRRCKGSLERYEVRVEVIMEDERHPFYLHEQNGLWNDVAVDEERNDATIIFSKKVKELSDLALKGAFYHAVGKVLGYNRIAKGTPSPHTRELENPAENISLEAVFDFEMLQEGAEPEAMIAYRVETTVADIKKAKREERASYEDTLRETFTAYCRTLGRLDSALSRKIRRLVEMQINSPTLAYEN